MNPRIEIMLPWPSLDLSPNARVHWATKAHAAKCAKHDAYLLTLEQTHGKPWSAPGKIRVYMRFCPPSHRPYDLDNQLAGCKPALDGIAVALGVDDQRFLLIPSCGRVLSKVGAVQIVVKIGE